MSGNCCWWFCELSAAKDENDKRSMSSCEFGCVVWDLRNANRIYLQKQLVVAGCHHLACAMKHVDGPLEVRNYYFSLRQARGVCLGWWNAASLRMSVRQSDRIWNICWGYMRTLRSSSMPCISHWSTNKLSFTCYLAKALPVNKFCSRLCDRRGAEEALGASCHRLSLASWVPANYLDASRQQLWNLIDFPIPRITSPFVYDQSAFSLHYPKMCTLLTLSNLLPL